MTEYEEYLEWKKTRIIAHMWHCGDEICNCYQPKIERITPNKNNDFPWIERELLWSGTFCTDGEDSDIREKELNEAIDRFRGEGFAVINLFE
jgi:hypothetical protein